VAKEAEHLVLAVRQAALGERLLRHALEAAAEPNDSVDDALDRGVDGKVTRQRGDETVDVVLLHENILHQEI
jgi:hypothetical protein